MSNNSFMNDQGFVALRQWVLERTGIAYHAGNIDVLAHRLRQVAISRGLDNYQDLYSRLAQSKNDNLHIEIANAVSTNHTFFFREPETINYFAEHVLPHLASLHEPIRIWSAASSTGQELYSLAMVASEFFGAVELNYRCSFLGTDISMSAVRKAEDAVYSLEEVSQVPLHLKQKHFRQKSSGLFELDPVVHKACIFRRLNLNAHPYPFTQRFHAIFCRNVLYYFDENTQRNLLEKLYHQVVPGGWLFTSVTESIRSITDLWQPVVPGVYHREQK